MSRVWVVLILVMFTLPIIMAGEDKNPTQSAELDEFTKERADKAVIEAMKSYKPHPEEVTQNFTEQISEWVFCFLISNHQHSYNLSI